MKKPISKLSWSDWHALSPAWSPSPAVLDEVLDGGQSFRWHRGDGFWTGQWADQFILLRPSHGSLEWCSPVAAAPAGVSAVADYFAQATDWAALTDSLPWRSDPHLAECIRAFPQLRLLRQPFGETLLGFLCSATKQIVQIKQMCALLAARHGAPLLPDSSLVTGHPSLSSRLPTWRELAAIPEEDLRQCLLGFRARYIAATAQYLATRPGWLEETERLPYPAAKARLLELPGVGEKVADCVLLFGAGRLEAFPVDTWVLKSLARRYGLVGWKPAQVAHFGRTHFGNLAGLAQQYLFAWERRFGGR
jgi:N-glycosylase/DNA lyase